MKSWEFMECLTGREREFEILFAQKEKQKIKLQELFDSVLYRSMTGELDVVK